MSDESKDLFGKIDALFEKRSADVLLDKGLEHEDFPVLTEVIAVESPSAESVAPPAQPEPPEPPAAAPAERRASDRRQQDRRNGDRRLGDRRESRQPSAPPRPAASREEVERLVEAVELRLSDLFIRQQLRMEEAVRKVIREEIAKAAPPPPGPATAPAAADPDLNGEG
ncbi:MAG: hypothetical protein AB1831_15600 [Pseudomonadota bacterium]